MSTFRRAVDQVIQNQRAQRNPLSSYSQSTLNQLDDSPLHIGDLVSIYIDSVQTHGFLNIDGIVDNRCGIIEQPKNMYPKRFRECVFMIHNANQYKAQKRFKKALEQYGLKDFDFRNISQYDLQDQTNAKETLTQLQKKMEEERENNKIEHERAVGRRVVFGQPIQLLHVRSKKMLTVARESAELQKDCMKVTLDEYGNSASIFCILPFFKFKIEGENVRLNDHIKIFNRKFALNLHASEKKFTDERYEVNMSSSIKYTKWKLRLFSSYMKKTSASMLKAGDVIRIQHKEFDGYLMVDDTSAIRKNACMICSKDDAKKYSTKILWEVEMADISRGGEIVWGNSYRLKHVASGLYLTAKPTNVEDSSDDELDSPLEEVDFTFGNEPILEPPKRTSTSKASKSKHKPTISWTAITKALLKKKALDIPDVEGPKQACSVSVSEFAGPDSLWSIRPIKKTEGAVPYDAFIRLYHNKTKSWLHALPSETDATQSLTRTQSILNTYQRVETTPEYFEEDVFTFSLVDSNKVDDLEYIHGLLPRMTNFVEQRAPSPADIGNLIFVFSQLIIFCTQSTEMNPFKRDGTPIVHRQHVIRERGVIDATMQILKLLIGNSYVKLNELKKIENIHYYRLLQLAYRFIKLCCSNNRKNGLAMINYIGTLQAHLEWDIGVAEALIGILSNNIKLLSRITNDQINFFIELLKKKRDARYLQFLSVLCSCNDEAISKNQDFIAEKLLDPAVIHTVFSLPFLEEKIVYVKINNLKVELALFTNNAGSDKEYEFFLTTIELLARLCVGRNNKSIAIVSELISYDLILNCIQNERLPSTLKAKFCDLLIHAYVNADPYVRKPLCTLTRKWTEIERQGSELKPDKFASLKQFIQDYFTHNAVLDIAATNVNQFILNLTRLVRYMFECGIYCHKKEIKLLITPLFDMLDGRNDTHLGRPMDSTTRYRDTESNQIITNIKLQICQIFHRIADIRLNHRITDIMTFFKHQYDNNSLKDNNDKAGNKESQMLSKLFKEFKFDNRVSVLDEVLMDLTQYENQELAREALRLLFRDSSQKEELANSLTNIELLVSPQMVKSYDTLNKLISKLRNILDAKLTLAEVSKAMDIIDTIIQDITKNGRRTQRILRNIGIHDLTVNTLHRNFSNKEFQKKIHGGCLDLITAFVKNNQTNQKLMEKDISFFVSLMDKSGSEMDTKITEMLIEIVKNNRNICSTLDEKIINHFVDAIAEHGLRPRYLNFLSTLIMVEDTPLKRNQTIITKALMERKKDVIVLFNDEEGLKERNELIKQNDHIKNPDGKLSYHLSLLKLLVACAEGKNNVTEVKLQSLMSIDEIITLITDPVTTPAIRNYLLEYFDEIYIYTEKKSAKLAASHSLWKLFQKLCQDLDSFLNRKNESTIDSHYIFRIVVPMIEHYFAVYYASSKIDNDQQMIIEDIVNKIIQLYHTTANPTHRSTILNVIKTMSRAKVKGKAEKLITQVIVKSIGKMNIKTHRDDTRVKLDSDDETIINNFTNYVKKIDEKIRADSDFHLVANEYKAQNLSFTETLVKILRNMCRKKNMLYVSKNVQLTLQALATLQCILDTEKTEEGLIATQNRLCKAGVPQLILELICCPNHSIVHDTLALGIRLLEGGNQSVQASIFETFRTQKCDDFFQAIRDRIRKSIIEIKERKQFIKRKQEKLQAFFESKRGVINIKMVKMLEQERDEEFLETGYIEKILRFLQLLCEGHNLDLQNYLKHQFMNIKSINIIGECLNYILELKKYITYSNIEIAIQSFITLTEFIQGPCTSNQQFLSTTKLYALANEILGSSYQAGDSNSGQVLKAYDAARLKYQVMITLISLLGGNTTTEIADLMAASLDLDIIVNNMKQILHHLTSEGKAKLKEQIQEELNNRNLYPPRDDKTYDVKQLTKQVLELEEELGIHYYFLLNILADSEQPPNKPITKLLEQHSKEFELFKKQTGRIEVVRDGQLERVYFRIPAICSKLSKRTRERFVQDCPRDTPQEKVKALFKETNNFKKEMEYYESLSKTKTFEKLVKPTWWYLERVGFFLSALINLIVMLTYTRQFDVTGGNPILVPGENLGEVAKHGEFVDMISEIVVQSLGILQLLLTLFMTLTYLTYFSPLNVRKQFDLDFNEVWSEKKRDFKFYRDYLKYLAKDFYIWFLLVYIVISILGLTVNPLIYSLQLFEIVMRSKTLQYVLTAVTTHWGTLIVTGMLMMVAIFFFAAVMFQFANEEYLLKDVDQFMCDTMFRCVVSVTNYGLRGGGWWEDIILPSTENMVRAVIDMSFFFVVIIVLINVVFGIILESFAELRTKKNETEEMIKNKCFICDIDRNRFDMRANEGITFEKHIKQDHYMWNYVAFLIYLFQKPHTEYTGIEQFLYEQAKEESIDFFPILRSMALEKGEKPVNVQQEAKRSVK